MASVPLSMNDLEVIVEQVARELLEDWAINNRFTEDELLQAATNSVNDTAFVINRFMDMLNDAMLQASQPSQDKSLII
jgi:hypothetical protein